MSDLIVVFLAFCILCELVIMKFSKDVKDSIFYAMLIIVEIALILHGDILQLMRIMILG